ncbi:hypothetical protein V6N13_004086 [Hibiscus sabdariffa]|uniref:Phospholipase A1 n=1 Tax=Hibiscus sabdariffa TaxID=183260 RepID=A0ABR2RXE3_9ROSI
MGSSIADRWRELSGEKNWEGLLQPLDPDLRRYIIHYGQMAGAVGDLFNSRTRRRYASGEELFSQACLVKGNRYEYRVSRSIYAGSERVDSAWIGYVAVATDQGKRALGRRDILIAWRGTATTSEWINNLQVSQRPTASDLFPSQAEVKVHRGFHSLFTGTKPDSTHNKTSAREQVRVEVAKLLNRYKAEDISITVTGFSLGAALATLTAMDIVTHGYNKPPNGEPFMVTTFTFGGPRVGNDGLARVFDTLGLENLRLLRIKNMKDGIPDHPSSGYTIVGKELIVDTSRSNYLKQGHLARNSFSGRGAGYQTLCWVLLLGSILYIVRGERNIRRDRDAGEYQDIGKDQDGCDLITISEDGVGVGVGDGDEGGMFKDVFTCHNMDVYLHGVAIKDIQVNTPIDQLDHDITLVNKHSSRVRDDYEFPPNWWAGENRPRMVQRDDGRWIRRRDVSFLLSIAYWFDLEDILYRCINWSSGQGC